MRKIIFLFLLAACHAPQREATNRWADEKLWPVLEAQEHRDTEALCALLKSGSPDVREAAALAFASVQDSASAPCLLSALSDESADVRATAAYALGFVADSLGSQRLNEHAGHEPDSTVRRACNNAAFLAEQRNGRLKDPNVILRFLRSSNGHEQVRAADALRKLPDSVMKTVAMDYMALLTLELPIETEAMLVRGLGKLGSSEAHERLRSSALRGKPEAMVISALRSISILDELVDTELFFDWVRPGPIGEVAIEALQKRENFPYQRLLFIQKDMPNSTIADALLCLAAKRAPPQTAEKLIAQACLGAGFSDSPYRSAAMVAALSELGVLITPRDSLHPMIQLAVFHARVKGVRENMMRSRFASRDAQYAQLREVVVSAIATGDAGLICAVAELLQEEEADAIRILLPVQQEKQAIASLQPIRDLEALLLLRQATAKRDGLTPPAHERPAFNHPINKERLLALKQGQRYRIVTNKGDIIIATDVNECPGSSLAFDSLVTAGYYNGKAFHRMVPNFVVQGGCPRGDGYGGMPWTLRTEIGRTPFKAGSVGLASAGPDTESCQFFITHSATPHLDGRYTRFGEVVSGMDVVWELQVGDVMQKVERAE